MSDANSTNEQDHWRRLAQELGLPFDDDCAHAETTSPAPETLPAPPRPRFADLADNEATPAAFDSAAAVPSPSCLEDAESGRPTSAEACDVAELESGEAEAKLRVRLEPVDAANDSDHPQRGRGRRRRGRGRGERRPDDEAAAGARSPLPESEAEATTDAIAPGAELSADADDEAGDAKEGEETADGKQPGRRKRRRRRRRKPDEAAALGGPAAEAVAASAEEKPAQRSAAVEEIEDETDEFEEEGDHDDPPRGDDTDDEPEEDFSDWSVPSWNELIAGLYRPDR